MRTVLNWLRMPKENYEQVAPAQKAVKIPLNSYAFETIVTVMQRSTIFKKSFLLNYTEAALSPLKLPFPVIDGIHEAMGSDTSLLQTFVHRLSSPAQKEFADHFTKKCGLQIELFNRGLFAGIFPGKRLSDDCRDARYEPILIQEVITREFPADFALFLYPQLQALNRVISNAELNRRSVFSFFSKVIEENFLDQPKELSYSWNATTLDLKMWHDRSSGGHLVFNYKSEEELDLKKDFLSFPKILFISDSVPREDLPDASFDMFEDVEPPFEARFHDVYVMAIHKKLWAAENNNCKNDYLSAFRRG